MQVHICNRKRTPEGYQGINRIAYTLWRGARDCMFPAIYGQGICYLEPIRVTWPGDDSFAGDVSREGILSFAAISSAG
jgi:hypothetical protein